MANSVYFKNCIREIRHTVYGRDNRKPIADAIQQIDTFYRKLVYEMSPTLDYMENKLQRAIGSIVPEPMETWYTYDYRDVQLLESEDAEDKIAEAVTDQLSVGAVEEDDFLLTDSIDDDTTIVISEDDYAWEMPNPIVETHVHHGEDYMLVITKINGS